MARAQPVVCLAIIFLFVVAILAKKSSANGSGGGNTDETGGTNGTDSDNGSGGSGSGGSGGGGGNKKVNGPTCSITKGGTLVSFLNARGEVEVPCRYIVGEFFCHSKVRVMAKNSLARDKRTFVSSMIVRKSRDPQDTNGAVWNNYDEVMLSMGDLRMIFEEAENQTWNETTWIPAGEGSFQSNDSKWILHVDYQTREVMLTDDNDTVHVSLSFVNKDTDMSNAGGLTVMCSHPTFGPLANSSGYLCGKVDVDTQHHLRDAADTLGLGVTDYITHSVFVQQALEQTDDLCERTTRVTSTCAYPVEAISQCAQFLHRSTYVYKCFQTRNISPLKAFASCALLRCRKDWASCNHLSEVLGDCPRYKRMKYELPCERVRQDTEE